MYVNSQNTVVINLLRVLEKFVVGPMSWAHGLQIFSDNGSCSAMKYLVFYFFSLSPIHTVAAGPIVDPNGNHGKLDNHHHLESYPQFHHDLDQTKK